MRQSVVCIATGCCFTKTAEKIRCYEGKSKHERGHRDHSSAAGVISIIRTHREDGPRTEGGDLEWALHQQALRWALFRVLYP